jgi:hypothetical protein
LTGQILFLLTSQFAIVVIGLSIANSNIFFWPSHAGLLLGSFVSCFGLFVWASFWFTDLVMHSVFVLALP